MAYDGPGKGFRRKGAAGVAAVAALAVIGGGAGLLKPSRSRIAANETRAIGVLRSLVSNQAFWMQSDADGNGVRDYWTGDVFGMYGLRGPKGIPVRSIPLDVARADLHPAGPGMRRVAGAVRIMTTLRTLYAVEPPEVPVPFEGYFFEALGRDHEGIYYAGADGSGRNPGRFGFRAVPAVYGTTGVNVYMVNEDGVIYGRDEERGAEADPPRADWPYRVTDPTTAPGPWRVVCDALLEMSSPAAGSMISCPRSILQEGTPWRQRLRASARLSGRGGRPTRRTSSRG